MKLNVYYNIYRISRVPKGHHIIIDQSWTLDEDHPTFKTFDEADEAVRNQLEIDRENGYCVIAKEDVGFIGYVISQTINYGVPSDLCVYPLCTREVGEPVFNDPVSPYNSVPRDYVYELEDAQFDRQVKDDTIKNIRRHSVTFTEHELDALSEVFHCFKDTFRCSPGMIHKAMALEKTLSQQTNGVYQPDTTYDCQN